MKKGGEWYGHHVFYYCNFECGNVIAYIHELQEQKRCGLSPCLTNIDEPQNNYRSYTCMYWTMIVEKRRSGKLPFLFFSIIISLFLCVYNDSLVFVYFIYVWLFSIWFYHIKKGRSLVRTPCCSYFTATLLPRTSYRYGLPVPASFLRRDGRSLSRQDGLLSCIPLGAMVNYVEICWTL